jgi:hypothetical protein
MAESGATITGGEKLTSRLQQMAENAGEGGTLRVGFLEGATYPDGTSVPMVAAIQEFGAPRAGIPPRPYFRSMIKQDSPAWPTTLGKVLPAVDYDTDKALGVMGQHIAEQLQGSIIDLQSPPLSPVTLMLRKMRIGKMDAPVSFAMVQEARQRVARGESYAGVSTKPLIYTGVLKDAVAYEIEPPTS